MEIRADSPAIFAEWQRWLVLLGPEDPYKSADTLGLHDILRAHFLIADYFFGREYGVGGIGPRTPDMLHAVCYRQFASWGGVDKWDSWQLKIATLIFGIVKDHPFHDANKRTALLCLLLMLKRKGHRLTVSHKALEDLMVEIAEGRLRRDRRKKEDSSDSHDSDIRFIAAYVRKHSRAPMDDVHTMTFNELSTTLRRFGFCLSSPSGNAIDVCRIERKRRGLFGLGGEYQVETRVAHIGFPGWKKQVPKNTLKKVREATGLVSSNGIDSATFFDGADPLNSLIDEYSGPLERLAFR
jgi:death-on-curing protein